MSKDRKTSNDYRKEYKEIKSSEKSLDSHLTKRILELRKLHPEAMFKAKVVKKITEVSVSHLTEDTLSYMNIETRLMYLESIEEYIGKKEKIVQTKINFTT
jgi:hypothetical protein